MVFYNGKIHSTDLDTPILGLSLPVSESLQFSLDEQRGTVNTRSPTGTNDTAQINLTATLTDPIQEVNPLYSYLHYQNFFIVYYLPSDVLGRFLFVWNYDFFGVLAAIAWTGDNRQKVKLDKDYGAKMITQRLADSSLIPLSFIQLVEEL